MKLLTRIACWTLVVGLVAACGATKSLTSGMRVAKNDAFQYSVTTATDMNISIMGQDMSSAGKQTTDYAFKITDVMPSGDFKSDVTIKRIAFNQTVPMVGDISYDSDEPEKSNNAALQSLGETVGKTFILNYDKEGHITKSEGVDKIVEDITKGLDDQVGQQIVSQMGTEGLTSTLKNLSGIIKGSPKVGSTWNVKSVNKGMVDIEMDQTFTLSERKNGQAIIDVTGTAKTSESEGGMKIQGMEIGYDLSGPIMGKIVVEEATGWAISSDIVPDLKGKMVLKGGPLGEMSAKAAMKIGISAVRK